MPDDATLRQRLHFIVYVGLIEARALLRANQHARAVALIDALELVASELRRSSISSAAYDVIRETLQRMDAGNPSGPHQYVRYMDEDPPDLRYYA